MSTKNYTIVESKEGIIYKVSKDKTGKEIQKEVVRCGCGEYISKRTMSSHQKSKKHHEWEIRQFRPWFVLTRYRDLWVQIMKLKAEMSELKSEFYWKDEDQNVIQSTSDEDKKEKFLTLKEVFCREDISLDELEETLIRAKDKTRSLKKKNKTKPVTKNDKPVEDKKSSSADKEEEEEEKTTDTNGSSSTTSSIESSSADKDEEDTTIDPNGSPSTTTSSIESSSPDKGEEEEKTTDPNGSSSTDTSSIEISCSDEGDEEEETMTDPNGSPPTTTSSSEETTTDPVSENQIRPSEAMFPPDKEYFIGSHPDPDLASMGRRMIVSRVHKQTLPDIKTFFKKYKIDVDKYSQDIRNETVKERIFKAVSHYDYLRGADFEDGWSTEDAHYFEREKFIRQFTLVRFEAIVRAPPLEGETPRQILDRLVSDPFERKLIENKPQMDMFYFYNEEEKVIYETEMVFPMILKKTSYNHGRCQVCQKWVGSAVKYPCKHSICDECHHKKKRGYNCIPQCIVCQMRYHDEWVIYLKEGETHDEEGNILKNGKIIKRYWEVQGV